MSRLLDLFPKLFLKRRIKRENKGLRMNYPRRKNISCFVSLSWKECGELKLWLPDDMFHSSSRTADKFAEEYDRHGDSYTENATSESLKKVFDNVQGNVSMQELERTGTCFVRNQHVTKPDIFSPERPANVNRPFSELASASVSERVFMQNLCVENEFDLHENESLGGTCFTWMVSHLDSFWHRSTRELRNGLLMDS